MAGNWKLNAMPQPRLPWPLSDGLAEVYLTAPEAAAEAMVTALAQGQALARRLDYQASTTAGHTILATWLTWQAQQTTSRDLVGTWMGRLAEEATRDAGHLLDQHRDWLGR